MIGGDRIGAAELGLRNIDRVVPMLIPATTKLGGSYEPLREMWDALVMQRHRELNAVAKMVGGVEEIRYQAGRGKAPFMPVPADQQRAAVKFLIKRAFPTPQAMLDPEMHAADHSRPAPPTGCRIPIRSCCSGCSRPGCSSAWQRRRH